MKPPKVLVIRFSSIGDIVLTSPVVRCLKEQLGAEVHFLTKRAYRGIVDANPHVDKVFAFQKELGEVLSGLRQEHFDVVIDLHHNLRSWRVRWALRGVRSFAFNKINRAKWLMVNLKINRLPKGHIVDRYLETVAPLGVRNDGKGLDYFIPEGQELALSDVAGQFEVSAGVKEQISAQQYFAFVIGAAHQTKRLPAEKIAAICRGLKLPVILLGGLADEEEGQKITTLAGPHVLNACGKYNLHQSASLVRQADKVITHDTGLMHIAAAFGKEIISIWGNTIPEFGMAPYYPQGVFRHTLVEVKGLDCRPCSKIGFRRCPKGHFRCMRDIDERQVIEPAMHFSPPLSLD